MRALWRSRLWLEQDSYFLISQSSKKLLSWSLFVRSNCMEHLWLISSLLLAWRKRFTKSHSPHWLFFLLWSLDPFLGEPFSVHNYLNSGTAVFCSSSIFPLYLEFQGLHLRKREHISRIQESSKSWFWKLTGFLREAKTTEKVTQRSIKFGPRRG